MNSIRKTLIPIISCIFLFSCAYNKEELPEPIASDSGITITYSSHAKAIFDNNCVVCHSPSGSQSWMDLSTYQGVKAQADIGNIKARAIDETPSVMPPTGSLSQNLKDTLQLWLNQGALQ